MDEVEVRKGVAEFQPSPLIQHSFTSGELPVRPWMDGENDRAVLLDGSDCANDSLERRCVIDVARPVQRKHHKPPRHEPKRVDYQRLPRTLPEAEERVDHEVPNVVNTVLGDPLLAEGFVCRRLCCEEQIGDRVCENTV